MKKIMLAAFGLWLSAILWAQSDSSQIKFIEPSDSTAIGTPDGKLVSKEIGPAGGTITSDDGRIELIFPEGVLTANTIINIQPTTNLAPNGAGKAYQFEPSGLQFRKPVQIIFHYTDDEAETCPPDLMGLAMQDHTGKWSFFDYDDWDSTAKILKGTIEHFSGASTVNKFRLIANDQRLRVNKETLIGIVDIFNKFKDGTGFGPAAFAKNDISVWYVNEIQGGNSSVGAIEPVPIGSKYMTGRFKAPSTIPNHNPVTVTAKILIASKKNKAVMNQKEAKCKISIYDGYEIKVIGIWDNTNLYGATERMIDTSNCSFNFTTNYSTGRVGTITNWTVTKIQNSLFIMEKQNCLPKCKCEYMNRDYCTGPVHITGIKNINISNSTASVYFTPAKGMMPLFKITCPKLTSFSPSFLLPLALPVMIKFELKDGEQEQQIDQSTSTIAKYKVIVRRLTE